MKLRRNRPGSAQPRPTPASWRQVAGFLLAALIALTAPGTASFEHVDVIFGQHIHDPVTRAVVPLVDERGHFQTFEPSSSTGEPVIQAQAGGLPDGLPHDLRIVAGLLLLAPALSLLIRPLADGPRLAGQTFGPAPPPPRS